jgi:hypothetical protein
MPTLQTVTLLPSAVRSPAGTITSDEFNNNGATSIQLYINITGASGTTPTLAISLQGQDPLSGTWFTLLTSASLTGVTSVLQNVGPGLPVTANISANTLLPTTFRLSCVTGGGGPSFTYSVGAILF